MIIAPVPGRAEVVRFATADKLDKVARECSDIAGRRMRVRFDADTTAGNATGATGSPSQGGPPPASRRAAMELPLVREAFEVFPDAMLIDVRSEPTD